MKIQFAMDVMEAQGFARRTSWPNISYIFKYGDVIMYSLLGIDSVWVPSHLDLFAADWAEIDTPTR